MKIKKKIILSDFYSNGFEPNEALKIRGITIHTVNSRVVLEQVTQQYFSHVLRVAGYIKRKHGIEYAWRVKVKRSMV